ncbi:MAG: ABC transporter permease subunit [Oscillospiraceae bacterium]|nr:ABC transporter permease subunit [Oscillospiraceae bacterium]
MTHATGSIGRIPSKQKHPVARFGRRVFRYRWLYIMLVPTLLYYVLFKFMPLLSLRIVFQKYSPALEVLGVPSPMVTPWYFNFQVFFNSKDFWMLMRNTFTLAMYNIVFYFPFPLLLSLLLNELRHSGYKRTLQSMVYLPHFLSWAVIASLVLLVLGPAPRGLVNSLLVQSGGGQIPFLYGKQWFRPIYIMELIWKEAGWGTIIYLAALSGVDEQLYEAAVIDGAGRFKQLIHITLPAIQSTIVILLILRMGSFLDTGFDQIYLMVNSLNRDIGMVFDTYIYDVGILGNKVPARVSSFSYSATVGLFRSVVSLVLVMGTNKLAKVFGEEGMY